MAATAGNRRVNAAAARAHTRKRKQSSSFLSSGLLVKLLAVSLVGLAAWFYQAIEPPPPRICGSPNGPPVESPRVRLKDGRHLSYKEGGVPREKAKHRIVYIHGFDSCKHDVPPLSKELAEELGVYLVSFDRAGYGESDPNPNRTEKSTALDVEELADQLGLGPKFYVIGFSMGGQATWGCIKYVPHRLAGVGLVTPVTNYWWPGFPANLSREAYYNQLGADQWALRVAHYLPWLTYWWNTRRWIPPSNVIAYNPALFSPDDVKQLPKFTDRAAYYHQVRQQGEYESLHRDMIVGFGTWEFDPMEMEDPFAGGEAAAVHLWQGDDDRLVPVKLQRYVAARLPWVRYHELPGAGHLFLLADGMFDTIVKTLVLGDGEQL
ncbi:unnamed protein product [Spirodela intermedia]|uniref:AB hydrolase-1 domain-containing protein n=1 Tax=Spirodela intermedia TaxID=51605 RepID=A0A7I8KIM3_SPIIN|nr:unnamed protein product [Spirodela intermedia]